MGGCFINELNSQDLKDQKQIINRIKNAPTQSIIRFLNDYQEVHSLKSYHQFLSQLKSLIIKEDNRMNEQGSVAAKFATYSDHLIYHTNQLMKLAKQCDNFRRLLEEELAKIKESWQKKKKNWDQNIIMLLGSQKKYPIRSEIMIDNQEITQHIQGSTNNQNALRSKEEIDERKNKINSILVEENEIEACQKPTLIMTQVDIITSKYEKQINLLNRYVKDLNQKLELQTQNSLLLKAQITQLKQQVSDLSQKLKKKNIECENFCKEVETLEKQLQGQKDRPSFCSSIVFKKFMNSKVVFSDYAVGKSVKGIIDLIFSPNVIKSSHLLFSYDKIRPNNMFEYIQEGKKNLILLALLENGTIIGGFSKCGFRQTFDSMANNHCFIFSIRPDSKYYKLELKGQGMAIHSVKLDKDYLKFGTNEIRVRCGTNQGKSTLNTKACIFQCKNNEKGPIGLQEFLGTSRDNYKMQEYEIFQLKVEEDTGSPPEGEMVSEIQYP